MKRASSDAICYAFIQTLNSFDEGRMLMLSMDGPMTKWGVTDKLGQHREENKMPVLLDVGSSRLQVVHGAFQAEVEATKWNQGKVFHAMLQLLLDSCRQAGRQVGR